MRGGYRLIHGTVPPQGWTLVPVDPPASLYPQLTGYEKPVPGDGNSERDRCEIENRARQAWAKILAAAAPSAPAQKEGGAA